MKRINIRIKLRYDGIWKFVSTNIFTHFDYKDFEVRVRACVLKHELENRHHLATNMLYTNYEKYVLTHSNDIIIVLMHRHRMVIEMKK